MLEKFKERVKAENWNFYSAAIWKDGKQEVFAFQHHSNCANIYSVSKSITAVAIGLLYDEGKIALDDPIIKYLGDHMPAEHDEKLPRVKIRHLLTQSSGIERGTLFEEDRYSVQDKDWIRHSLARPLPHEPGEHFCYDNANFYMLACIAEIVSGKPLTLYLREKIFDRMGIYEYAWERCPQEHCMGATGFFMNIEGMLKFGRLLLDRGVWEGERLLSEDYIDRAIEVKFPDHDNYGFSFRRRRGDIYCTGAANQLIYISPERNTVFAAQGYNNISKFPEIVDEIINI